MFQICVQNFKMIGPVVFMIEVAKLVEVKFRRYKKPLLYRYKKPLGSLYQAKKLCGFFIQNVANMTSWATYMYVAEIVYVIY